MRHQDFIQPGSELHFDGDRLSLRRFLTEGATSYVYKGSLWKPEQNHSNIQVVVKVMKDQGIQGARNFFLEEGKTLAELNYWEAEGRNISGEDLRVSPLYYGSGEYSSGRDHDPTPYLVMEFIPGQQVADMVYQTNGLPEKQVLIISLQLFHLLDILHTRLSKTYIDLKFDNLRWCVKNNSWGGQLKLIDFGTLGKMNKEGVSKDILQGGKYLFYMLTGNLLPIPAGDLEDAVDEMITAQTENFTSGTRSFLRRLLHKQPHARYSTASEALADIRRLVNP